MSPDFSAGLQVSVFGLLITFAALGVFILIILALKALFREKAETPEALSADEVFEETPVMVEAAGANAEGEIVAAIAAALMYARAARPAALGQSLLEGRGSWWAAQRADAHEGSVKQR